MLGPSCLLSCWKGSSLCQRCARDPDLCDLTAQPLSLVQEPQRFSAPILAVSEPVGSRARAAASIGSLGKQLERWSVWVLMSFSEKTIAGWQ